MAYDAANLDEVMAYTDHVFVGRVLGVENTDVNSAKTTYRIEVDSHVVGDFPERQILVRQLGYVDSDGIRHVPEEQALIGPGKSYLLATNLDADDGSYVVTAGPLAVRAITDGAQSLRLSTEYEQRDRIAETNTGP